MKQRDNFDFDDAFIAYDDVEKIVRRARAERNATLRRAIGSAVRKVVAQFRHLATAIDAARRLRALATNSDRRLKKMGIDRSDLPAIVYGWICCRTLPVAEIVPIKEAEINPVPDVRVAA